MICVHDNADFVTDFPRALEFSLLLCTGKVGDKVGVVVDTNHESRGLS